MTGPTPFSDLNALLDDFVASTRAILGDDFVGAYLQGSFAVGDADEHSDVDFIVVTEGELSDERRAALQAMHRRLYARSTPWAQHLEGSYFPRDVVRRVDPQRRPLVYLDNGATEFELDNHCNTAVVRWSLREHGVVLAGPPALALVDRVTPGELQQEVRTALTEWDEWARATKWSRRKQGLIVLSYCRMLQTLAEGRVTSKHAAGEWALEALGPEWRLLIRKALDDRPDQWGQVRQPADPALVERTLQFMDYATARAATLGP
jgi:hypothetical protein